MTVERIRNLDINNRPIFTGIYGNSFGQEYYVENNLCKYNFWQELYRYLRSEGYTTVFYNTEFNFFAYEESQLETLFFKKPEEISGHSQQSVSASPTPRRFVARIASPNGRNRMRGIRLSQGTSANQKSQQPESAPTVNTVSPTNELVSHRPNAILVHKTETDQFFQIKSNEAVLHQVFGFIDKNPGHKLAVVFTMPTEISFGDIEGEWITNLQSRFLGQLHKGSNLRLITLYDFKDINALYESFRNNSDKFFFKTWFKDQIFPEYRDNQNDLHKSSNALFYVDSWGKDEVGNILKRRRIMEGLDHTLAPIPFDDLCLRIWQQFTVKESKTKEKDVDTVLELMGLPKKELEQQLLKMDNEKAMDKLQKLLGMDGIIAQFERYLNDMRACKENGEKFRKHMVFMGNPGTGKTTVARIFSDVLREEGLLENGRLHQVTVGDLIGQYVGQTRIKTQEVCQRAKGGVLFIDEAYGLYQSGSVDTGTGGGSNQFGQEAIEVLLQFMENDDTSLVIMAGYPSEMEDLLKNGNAGFNSRIGEQGRFMFEDYKPEVLLKIALAKLKRQGYTDDFKSKLHAIFSTLYRFKDKDWANARTAENTISKIKSNYRAKNLTGPFDARAIQDDLQRLIRVLSPEEEQSLTRELDGMIGLQKVKANLKEIFDMAKGNRIRMEKLGDVNQSMSDLTFVFEGNPGTGKTTVARLMGKILAGYGLIQSAEVKEYGKGNIVSTVRGGSVKLVNEMFDNCIGRVLFIDEAYALAEPDCKDAVDQIVQNMTQPKYRGKMAVVMAGYPGDMQKLLDVNAGMERRFKYRLQFDDYTNEELTQMYKNYVGKKNLLLSEGCDNKILAWFKSQKRGKNFGNAGLLEKLHQEVMARNGQRLINSYTDNPDFYKTIIPDDIPDTILQKNKSDEEVLAELNNMVGLRKIKNKLNGIIANAQMQQMRAQIGQKAESKIGLNFVFKGNPGTGKTTVARLLGNILANYGLIEVPEVVTYTKGNLIDGTVGGGSRNVEKMFDAAVGRVLFIDEAYQLAENDSKDALDALTNMMTDKRYKDKMAIILAGYPGDMAKLITSNPGLKSRFTQEVVFEDYNDDELTEIFAKKLSTERFMLGEEDLLYAKAYFSYLKRGKDFGNARETEKLRDDVKSRQGTRLMAQMSETGIKPTEDELTTILPQDFPNYGRVNLNAFRHKDGPEPTPIERLDNLIGIDVIREQFRQYIKMAHYCQENPQAAISSTFRPHMAFLGNPGTGKSTVARLFGLILREEGLLPNSNFVEVSPDDLIGEYVGHSAPKARSQFERARGGVLFIDEAYELFKKGKDGGGNQFGQEVITALIKFMEDDRDTVVILAGYTDEIRYLIKNGNPGLTSRVTNEFLFNDYEPEVLFSILLKKLSEQELSDEFRSNMQQIISYEYEHRNKREWGNARTIENYANDIFKLYLNKHDGKGVIGADCIPDYLLSDLIQVLQQKISGIGTDNHQNTSPQVSSLSIDLTRNPSGRRAFNISMLKERATGLLRSSVGEGTGFVISIPDRYVLTCSHVIEGAGSDLTFAMNCNRHFETSARVIWSNYEQDMALLQLDELPDDACYVEIDNHVEKDPQELTELVLCGYPDGSAFASTPSLIAGSVNNYEKNHEWNDRCFDTIYANVSATHGCSGGPVVRKSDMVLIGLLQGGKEGGEIQFITDIHQLFRNINIKS